LAQVQLTPEEKTRVKAKGQLGFGLWRSVYLMKQASMRNRVLVFFDWMKTRLFGRDITSIE
jgi:NADH dehydrogenase FAD-containing subunit